jgi:hypothetical protein
MSKYLIIRGSDFHKTKPLYLQKSKIQNSATISDKNIPWFNGDFSGAAIFETYKDAQRWDWLSIGNPKIMSFDELGIPEPKSNPEIKSQINTLF